MTKPRCGFDDTAEEPFLDFDGDAKLEPADGRKRQAPESAIAETAAHAALQELTGAGNPDGARSESWEDLSKQLFAVGNRSGAEAASTRAAILAVDNAQLSKEIANLQDGDISKLEGVLLGFLEAEPDNAHTLNLLAEVALNNHFSADAEVLLERCLEIAPDFTRARYNYASALLGSDKFPKAITELELLLERDAGNPFYRTLMGEALLADSRLDDALLWHEKMVRDFPRLPLAYLGHGQTLGAMGKGNECLDVYRKMLLLFPWFAPGYWGLANLSSARFTSGEISALRCQLARAETLAEDRVFLSFSLARTYEADGDYERAFETYAEANAIHRAGIHYNPNKQSQYMSRCRALFTAEFLGERASAGCTAAGPIFIVGMPRSGSSLVDQILASHSEIEGMGELPEILTLAKNIHYDFPGSDYPEVLGNLDPDALAAIGEQYLKNCLPRRKLRRPYFIDKAPRNFIDIGLIHLILPNAKIIDVRRHPLGCCVSNFTQHFSGSQPFTYNLTELGDFYRRYVQLMAHYDEVLPGKIHRIFYEDIVTTFEEQVRRLFEYLELPFEEQCLRFYENPRYVRTASTEQVRSPIYVSATTHWRNYEPWLGELNMALGSVLHAYPDVPTFE